MDFGILGPLEVSREGRPVPLGGNRQRTVLALLLLRANKVVPTDRLIDELWGDEPPDSSRKSLQVYVSRLRKALGDGLIKAVSPGYVLSVVPEEIDAGRFEHLAAEGRRLLRHDPEQAGRLLHEALALWRGQALADVADEPALHSEALRLEELRLTTLEDRIEADLALGHHDAVVGELEGLITDHPFRERFRAQLMLALYQSGRQAEALRVYRRTRAELGDELGIEPSLELQQLEERILLQDPELDPSAIRAPERASEQIRNPYKGLRAFSEADADDFFGREELVTQIVGMVSDGQRLVALVGPSGCGKSSVLRAGVVPALRAGRVPGAASWPVALARPGAHPFAEVEAALVRAAPSPPSDDLLEVLEPGDDWLLRAVMRILPDDGQRLVLVLDQFEELFVLVDDETVRRTFLRTLATALEDPHGRLIALLTLRGDFYDRPLLSPEFAGLFLEGMVGVAPLRAEGLQAAAEMPARAVGMTVESPLVGRIVADVVDQPGALPQFQYALTELFDTRTADVLTLDAYDHIGGLRGILARRAETMYQRLSAAERKAARQVFLRLTSVGEQGHAVRQRVPLDELDALHIDAAQVGEVLDQFGRHRLLSFDYDPARRVGTVEVAHEALLEEWDRLHLWLDAARADLRLRRALAAEVGEWTASGRHRDYLVTGARLARLDEWSRVTQLALTGEECAYLAASLDRDAEERTAERDRQERELRLERRAVRRLRSLVAVLAVATLLAAGLTLVAANRSQEAGMQAEVAEQEAVAARLAGARALAGEFTQAAIAGVEVDPQRSLLLGLEAVVVSDLAGLPVSAETAAALHLALQMSGVQYPIADGDTVLIEGPTGLRGAFDLPFRDLLDLSQSAVTRSLSPDECARFFAGAPCPELPTSFSSDLRAERPGVPPPDPAFPLGGTTVRLLSPWQGREMVTFEQDLERFTEQTGIEVIADDPTNFGGRLIDPSSPRRYDLASPAQPALIAELAQNGVLMDLGVYLDEAQLIADYGPDLLSLMTVGPEGSWPASSGRMYGLPVAVDLKGLILYPLPEFRDAGYEIPATWDELMRLSEQMVADGHTPWCLDVESGGASGWPATDIIEVILLREAGPETYDRWVTHGIPFTDPAIRSAFVRFGEIAFSEGWVLGGPQGAPGRSHRLTIEKVTLDPPLCWLAPQANFALGWAPGTAAAGVDFDFFPMPALHPDHADAVVGGGTSVFAMADRPEVRELVRFLAGPEFGKDLVNAGQSSKIMPNRRFDLAHYPNELARSFATISRNAIAAGEWRFDGSDLMPGEVVVPFWQAMLTYLEEGPDSLDRILSELESTWPDPPSQ